MISKIRAGILSCIGLMIINLLRGVIMIPGLELGNEFVYSLIVQIGLLWFSISLWIVLRYDLVKLNELEEFKKPIEWLIRIIGIAYGAGIISTFFPNRELYLIAMIAGLILAINYLIVFVKIYKLDKDDLEFVADLHYYVISLIIIFLINIIINAFNEFKWRMQLDFIFHLLNVFPIIFLIRFLLKEKRDIKNKLRGYLIIGQ